jgi:ribonuclease HI
MELHTYSDGGARGNPGPAAIGVVICDAEENVLQEASKAIGHNTNNVAEYNAMILALELARKHGGKQLVCYADSELLIFQLTGVYRIKDDRMKALAARVRKEVAGFEKVTFRHVRRSHPMITRADKLLNQTLDRTKSMKPDARSRDPHQQNLF